MKNFGRIFQSIFIPEWKKGVIWVRVASSKRRSIFNSALKNECTKGLLTKTFITPISENLLVYETLRNEILMWEETQRNLYLYMYSTYLVLLVLGVEKKSTIAFLITYIILIPFQWDIRNCSRKIRRMSIYIYVFFENSRNDIHWESFQMYPSYISFSHKKGRNNLLNYQMNSFFLAILSLIFIFYYVVFPINQKILIDQPFYILAMMAAFCLTIWTYSVSKHSYHSDDSELLAIIRCYKNDVEEGKINVIDLLHSSIWNIYRLAYTLKSVNPHKSIVFERFKNIKAGNVLPLYSNK